MDEQLNAIINWIALGTAVFRGGEALWNDIKGVFQKHGIEQDTAALDALLLDAARRKAIAHNDAQGGTA